MKLPLVSNFKTVGPHLGPHRRDIVCGLLSLVLTSFFLSYIPLVLARALDAIESRPDAGLLLRAAAFIVLLAALRGVFLFAQRWYLMRASREVEFALRQRLFEHIERLPAAFFSTSRVGDVMSRATSDLEAVRMTIGPGVMYIASTFVQAPLSLAFMLSMNTALTFVALFPLVLLAVVVRIVSPRVHELSKRLQDQIAALTTRAQESFAGARVVRTFAQEENEERDFDRYSVATLSSHVSLAKVQGLASGTIYTLTNLGVLLILWVGGFMMLGDRFTVGQFIAFSSYQFQLTWPMIAIGWVLALYQRGAAAMRRIDAILETPVEPETLEEAPEGVADRPFRGEVEFKGLTFAFADGREALRDISFRVPAGSMTAIVGPTGSGKSTLLSLLPRLLEPPPGTVFVDGVDVRRIPVSRLRGLFSVVPQDGFLFSETLRFNVAFGEPGSDEAQVRRAAELAGLTADPAEFPRGLDQIVGERGIVLSGGQRQRAALARALLLDDRAIVLVDDALSAVDTETEERILEGLRRALEGRTRLVVSHRVSTVRHADRIVVLKDGALAETGTHEELLARKGLYADMIRRQRLEEEIEALS